MNEAISNLFDPAMVQFAVTVADAEMGLGVVACLLALVVGAACLLPADKFRELVAALRQAVRGKSRK